VSEWTLEAASTGEAIDRVAAAGYPAIELAAVPELDVGTARERLDARGLQVSSMCWIGLGYPAELERAAQTSTAAIDAVSAANVVVALEALNRYETHLLRTLADADQLRRMIDSLNVQLMADVFHMNIEEDSIATALRKHAEHIAHVHLADSQRREPGSGHLDFDAVFEALADNDYGGTFAMEFLPATEAALRAGREWVERFQNVP
jgi:sugar phosphate isomerase/epimerase